MATTVTVTTTTQAEFANRLRRAAYDLNRVLKDVAQAATQDAEYLAQGLRPLGISHQTLAEVTKYQAQFEALSEMALVQGLTPEQVHTLVTDPRAWAVAAE